MRKVLVLLAAVVAAFLANTASASAESPYKFGPHDVQCSASPNQPNCTGSL